VSVHISRNEKAKRRPHFERDDGLALLLTADLKIFRACRPCQAEHCCEANHHKPHGPLLFKFIVLFARLSGMHYDVRHHANNFISDRFNYTRQSIILGVEYDIQ
jgi:hypothetical protein